MGKLTAIRSRLQIFWNNRVAKIKWLHLGVQLITFSHHLATDSKVQPCSELGLTEQGLIRLTY